MVSSAAVLDECRRVLRTRSGLTLLVVTLALGLLTAVGLASTTAAAGRSVATIAPPVQSLMSVTLPFLGVLLVSDLRHREHRPPLVPRLVAAVAVAVGIAAYGVLLTLLATAVGPTGAHPGRWHHLGLVVLGSVLVQVLAQLVGTAMGLLIRSTPLAMAASIVVPLGLWLLLEAIHPLRPAQAWLTPFASVSRLLSGTMGPLNWVEWLVVAALWGPGLNLVAARRLGGPVRPGR